MKERSKLENIERYHRTLEYKKDLYLQKLKARQQTHEEMKKLKREIIQERYYNHMIDQIKKDQLKSSIEEMHYFKKFDKEKIKEIAKDFEFLTQIKPVTP